MKYAPKKIVIVIDMIAFDRFVFRREWWAQVMDAPDDSKITELRRGIPMGLNVSIPAGGHCLPISIAGAILEWKNAQKNLTKNSTSDRMNIAILFFRRLMILVVWCPWNVDSRTISRHH